MKSHVMNKDFFIAIFGLIAAVAALIVTIATPELRLLFGLRSLEHVEETVSDKFKQLDQVEFIMKQFQLFVENQRKELEETNEVLLELKSKKKELQSIVNAGEYTVEAFFKLQEERASSKIWCERLFGFVMGTISSILASIIWSVSIKIAKRRNDQLKQPTSHP